MDEFDASNNRSSPQHHVRAHAEPAPPLRPARARVSGGAWVGSTPYSSSAPTPTAPALAPSSPRWSESPAWLERRSRPSGGAVDLSRARPHIRFAPPLVHSIPDPLKYSVPLFLKRQCDRRWRRLGRDGGVVPLCGGGGGRPGGRAPSKKGVRLVQEMQVSPCIPVGIQP